MLERDGNIFGPTILSEYRYHDENNCQYTTIMRNVERQYGNMLPTARCLKKLLVYQQNKTL